MEAFNSHAININHLFPEILTIIFRNLDINDKGRVSQVNRTWRDAAYNRRVWRGVKAKLHLRNISPTLFQSLVRRGITKIQVLSVNPSAKRNHLREVLTGIENLDSLDLSGCYCVNEHLLARALVTVLPTLSVLNLSLCKQIKDSSIERIVKCAPNLQYLDVAGCSHLTTHGLTEIARDLSSLRHLNLRSCRQISDRAIGYLCGQNVNITGANGNLMLESLVLQDCQKLSDLSLKYIAEGLPKLRSLNLSFCASITDVGIRFLAKISSLRDLNVSSCDNVSDIGVGYLSEGCARIQRLDVSFCERVGEQSLVHMSQGLYHLQHLSMRNCDVTDEGLSKLIRSAPDISVLQLGQCSKVTDISIRLIAEHLNKLELIDLYGCHRITRAGLEPLKHLPNFQRVNLDLWQKS